MNKKIKNKIKNKLDINYDLSNDELELALMRDRFSSENNKENLEVINKFSKILKIQNKIDKIIKEKNSLISKIIE